MLPAILGKKIGMTQVYDADGVLHPVTVVQAGPCSVLQIKTPQCDGYHAVQLGYEDVKPHRAARPQIGHAARANLPPKRFVREVRCPGEAVTVGQEVTVEQFEGVAFVDVVGTTKGRGFAGGMKRHGFKGQPASHGVERKHRSPGSIASHASDAGTGPKPKKGKRMAGHMGAARKTSRNHRLIAIDPEDNLLLIKGPLPGANGGLLLIRQSKTARAGS
jgi:large subunit ribosomal protein L3